MQRIVRLKSAGLHMGMSNENRLLAVSHTYNDDDPEHIRARIISAQLATARERAQYEQ